MVFETTEHCPFLTPVVTDRLWLFPTSVYCRRPDHRVRVPAAATIARLCGWEAFRTCPGYRSSLALLAPAVPAPDEPPP